MSKSLTQSVSAISLLAAMGMPHLASAQTAPDTDSGAEARQDGSEIVVTARKKEELLADVPLQISVFSSDDIEQQDFRDLTDVAQRTPGLEYENFATSGLTSAPVIRGMAQTFTTSRIQNTAAFIDGIYLQRQSMVNPGLLEVDRIEVVKGPQSAVYGRNAFAGSINYVTKKPAMEWEGLLGGTIGNGGRYDYQGSLSGPIAEDILAVRFSYARSKFDGHTRNQHPFANDGPDSRFSTDDRLGGWDDETYSISATFTPDPDVEIGFLYYNFESVREPQPFFNISGARLATTDESWDAASNQGNCLNTMTINRIQTGPATFINVPIFGNHAFCGQLPTRPLVDNVVAAAGFPTGQIMVDPRSHASQSETEIISAHLLWDVTDQLNLKYQFGNVEHSATGFGVQAGRDSVVGWLVTQPGPPFPPPPQYLFTTFNANPIEALESTSHEFRINYDGDQFDFGLGLYLSKTDDEDSSRFFFPGPCNSAASCGTRLDMSVPAGPPVLIVPRGPFLPPLELDFFPFAGHGINGDQAFYEDDVTAIFGSFEWNITDELTFSAEARYEWEDKSFNQVSTTFGRPTALTAEEEFKFFTPRATLRWKPDWADGGLFYGLIAKGIKTGGFNSVDLAVNPEQLVYSEETNWTYELGARGTLFDGLLGINMAVYYIDWQDIQGSEAANSIDPFAADVVGNIGDAEVFGLELDGFLAVSDSFEIDYSFAWLDPTYKSGIYASARTINADGTPNLASSFGCTAMTPECDATGDISGNTLERTSTLQATMGLNYNREVNIVSSWDMNARVDFSYRNKMYATPLNLADNGDRLLTNASLSFSNDNFSISLWGKNIFDKKYVANSFVLQSFNRYIVGLGAERTFGLTVKAGF